jgi:hypothetical protein
MPPTTTKYRTRGICLTAIQGRISAPAANNGKKWQWFLSGSNDVEWLAKVARPPAGGLAVVEVSADSYHSVHLSSRQ